MDHHLVPPEVVGVDEAMVEGLLLIELKLDGIFLVHDLAFHVDGIDVVRA